MIKRLLDCSSSDFKKMTKNDLLASISASEGRVMVTEVIGALQPVLLDISNAELACSFGSDILLLNFFDVYNPVFNGIPTTPPENIIEEIKKLTGRPIGINLEPVDENEEILGEKKTVTKGRLATVATAKKAFDMGVNLIVLTGNPGTGVTNNTIISTLNNIDKELGDKIILAAGKMHAAGSGIESGNNLITKETIKDFIEAGADIILLPAPGTVPGITAEYIKDLIDYCHSLGKLTITSIGTSQEGSDISTIRQIALMCKMCGTDMHHIGDAGFPGMAIPENILEYSIAIRGRRHTYSRMARSINR